MERQMVVFAMADEFYGVDIASVESIVKMQAITALPHVPEYIEGVTNLRGVVLPVIDLRKRFGYPSREINKDSRIIVINMGLVKTGMIVDEVSEVLTISDSFIEPPPVITTSLDSDFISGIAKMDNRLIIILDLTRVLSHEAQTKLIGSGVNAAVK